MKKITQLSVSLLLGAAVLSSCSTNKLAMMNGPEDNMYFRASDVQIATQYAVENNNPRTFENLSQSPALVEENFSSRNVNPEYISRYQATTNDFDNGAVYFDDGGVAQSNPNINAYDNFYSSSSARNNFSSPNINFNFGLGLGFGMNPWGYGIYDPFWGPNWGWRPGFSWNIGIGWGYPSLGLGYGPRWGWGPSYGWGMPIYPVWGYPVYAGYPAYTLPGGEQGGRRVVYGARPTRGSSMTNSNASSRQASVMPSTARAQNRAAASGSNPSARRIAASENSRVASRDFGTSQNDYYNSGRSRVSTSPRNISSPATDRTVNTRSRTSIPSARHSTVNPGTFNRSSYPSRGNNSYNNQRSNSPSYNRSVGPTRSTRSTNPTYNNRSTSPTYNRSNVPSRSNNSEGFSAPSRSSSGGSNVTSTPSRSSSGSSGSNSSGSRGGRGN
jgi:hypothetical protein